MACNYHTHTTFCDGKNNPEEMVLKAIELGMEELGFSGHSYLEFDDGFCMSTQGEAQYIKTVIELREKYKDKIKILLGIEQDYFSEPADKVYEYIIGSVHYVFKNGVYLAVDSSKQAQINAVNEHYNGDFYSFIEDYYALVADVYNKTKCDIIGHFDLITKFNSDGRLFDTNHPRYIKAYTKALDSLLRVPVVFEINTGAMARGYTNAPYPSKDIILKLKRNNVKTIFSSDCHNKDNILYKYEEYKDLYY